MSSTIRYTDNPVAILSSLLEGVEGRAFVLCDTNTAACAYPLVAEALADATLITIPAGDEHKTLATATRVWERLSASGATRSSVLVNLGGGVVTDLGGFVAATFKRGMRFINVPTTLLGAVDAAVGGKTGVNLGCLKNEVGVFAEATDVVVCTRFFATLPEPEILSGYAEMLKHALLTGYDEMAQLIADDPVAVATSADMARLLRESMEVKQRIVDADPREQGLRKALNLGHTAGHAFEELALEKGAPVSHGYAVAWGLVTEVILSHILYGYPSADLHAVTLFVKEYYGTPPVACGDYDRLIELMRHDKKNRSAEAISFSLLRTTGDIMTDCVVEPDDIATALDITRDLLA